MNSKEKVLVFWIDLLYLTVVLLISNYELRPPRSYKKFGHDWKASEYRNFLIFHGVLVMIDILPKEQLAHLSLLSHSIHKLLQHSISNHCIKAK